MADAATVARVKLQIIDNADAIGFDDAMIGTLLDSGLTETKTILAAWRATASKAATIEDVQESGSSRTVALFDRANSMITVWQGRADAEDQQSGTLPAKAHGASRTSVRV